MTADQLRALRDIREQLDNIRGNEEEVQNLRREINSLIRQSVAQAKDKIDVLANVQNPKRTPVLDMED